MTGSLAAAEAARLSLELSSQRLSQRPLKLSPQSPSASQWQGRNGRRRGLYYGSRKLAAAMTSAMAAAIAAVISIALVVAMAATAALCITIRSPRSRGLLCVIYSRVHGNVPECALVWYFVNKPYSSQRKNIRNRRKVYMKR